MPGKEGEKGRISFNAVGGLAPGRPLLTSPPHNSPFLWEGRLAPNVAPSQPAGFGPRAGLPQQPSHNSHSLWEGRLAPNFALSQPPRLRPGGGPPNNSHFLWEGRPRAEFRTVLTVTGLPQIQPAS